MTNQVNQYLPTLAQKTATILSGQTASDEIDVKGACALALFIPTAWTTADLTFIAAPAAGGAYSNALKNSTGVYTFTSVAAGDLIILDPVIFAGLEFIKIVSSVTQAANRAIIVNCGPLLTQENIG